MKSKAELEHLTETRPVQINRKGVPIKKEMTHLGITRNNTQPNANIEDRISCARKTFYALMGSGLHGLNGLPVSVYMHLYRTFILTRALYGLEATYDPYKNSPTGTRKVPQEESEKHPGPARKSCHRCPVYSDRIDPNDTYGPYTDTKIPSLTPGLWNHKGSGP